MSRSRCDANWQFAASRLTSLAASFGAVGLMELAEEALRGAPGDPVVLSKLRAAIDDFGSAEANRFASRLTAAYPRLDLGRTRYL
jgi:hypothetical protein